MRLMRFLLLVGGAAGDGVFAAAPPLYTNPICSGYPTTSRPSRSENVTFAWACGSICKLSRTPRVGTSTSRVKGCVRHLELHVGRVADLRASRDVLAAVCLRSGDAKHNVVSVEAVLECEVDLHGTRLRDASEPVPILVRLDTRYKTLDGRGTVVRWRR